jgi:FtsH-binding integral membrane protein
MNFGFRTVQPLVITFFVLTGIIFAAKFFYTTTGMMGGNCLFFLISLIVFRMQYAAMYNSNPNVFIRSVMSGLIIKMFGCVIAVVVYYFISKASFNKPAVYVSMLIYLVYLVVEVRAIMKLNKTKNA